MNRWFNSDFCCLASTVKSRQLSVFVYLHISFLARCSILTSPTHLRRGQFLKMPNSPSSDDIEKASNTRSAISYRSLLLNHGYIDPTIASHLYPGSGTVQDPYLVSWLHNDPRNPQSFKDSAKWVWTLLVALGNTAVALATSAYTAHSREVKQEFHVSQEVFELGLSLFVLGFAIGPLFWGPLSELYGRQIIFFVTVCRSSRRAPGPLLTFTVRVSHRVQRWLCCGAEHGRSPHHEIPRWHFRLIAFNERWWCRS
jgi:hypothetical protein